MTYLSRRIRIRVLFAILQREPEHAPLTQYVNLTLALRHLDEVTYMTLVSTSEVASLHG